MITQPLLKMTSHGFYCEAGDFYVDPWQPVPRAVVTHAHGDHLTRGCQAYLIAQPGETVARTRLDPDAVIHTLPYGETTTLNDVRLSFHPAGHILGSAQIRIEYRGEVWVVSGDYKRHTDLTCTAFEVVPCHHFITEATFALPIYTWQPPQEVFQQINNWWSNNVANDKASILYCYALGKAQRIIASVDPSIGTILTHGAVERLNHAYRAVGVPLPPTHYAKSASKADMRGALIIAPVSARGTSWVQRFGAHVSGFASGWMRIRGARRQKAVDRGFILSDHADWHELLDTIRATGAERVGVTHGYVPVLVRWLQEQGISAYGIETRYTGETTDVLESAEEGEA